MEWVLVCPITVEWAVGCSAFPGASSGAGAGASSYGGGMGGAPTPRSTEPLPEGLPEADSSVYCDWKSFEMPDFDYYKALGVKNDATLAEIKKAHKKAVLKYHPDRYKGLGVKNDATLAEIKKALGLKNDATLAEVKKAHKEDATKKFHRATVAAECFKTEYKDKTGASTGEYIKRDNYDKPGSLHPHISSGGDRNQVRFCHQWLQFTVTIDMVTISCNHGYNILIVYRITINLIKWWQLI